MGTYQYAAGHNNSAGLINMTIEPKAMSIDPGRVTTALNWLNYTDGYSLGQLIYTDTVVDSDLTTIFSELGLTSAESALMTMKLPSRFSRTFAAYNVVVHRPRNLRYEMGRWKNVVFDMVVIGTAT